MSIFSRCRWSFVVRSLFLTLAAAFAFSGSGAAQAAEAKPIAVITVNSLDNLFDDANFIGGLMGQPNLAAQYQPMLQGFTPGLDHSRPIGLIVQSDGATPSGALCLPVTDLKQLLAVLKNFGVMSEEKENGMMEISAQGQTLFARETNGWALLSMMPQMLEGLPDNPGELFAGLTKEYDLGIRVHVQNIPEAYTQMALSQLEAGMEAGMEQLEEESEEAFAARREMTSLQVDQIKQAVEELDELTLGVAVDSEGQRTLFDMSYTAISGSKLAEQIALNSDPKTDYAGFLQPDAAMMMSFASKIAESDMAKMEQMFEAARKQISTAIAEEAGDSATEENLVLIEGAIDDFLDALQATMQAGKMDGGAVLNLAPSSLSFVAGGFIGDPSKVESGLKKLVEVAQNEDADFPEINWNASSHADVQFHTISIPIPAGGDKEDENARKLFGDTIDVAVGIGRESAYFAFGRNCLDAVERVMDLSAASPQKSVAPMEMTFSLSEIMETVATFADEEDRQMIEEIANMLANEAAGRDHIRMVVQPIANGARFRMEAEEGVLRAIGQAAMAAQMKQMEAAGAGGF